MAEIYSDGKTLTLRQEALNRVREMQRRAQILQQEQNAASPPSENSDVIHIDSGDQNRNPQTVAQSMPTGARRTGRHTVPPNGRQRQAAPNGIADLLRRQGLGDRIGGLGETVQNTVSSVSQPLAELLESFGVDGEKLIILMVMWAVFNQNKDNKALLMALGYILL